MPSINYISVLGFEVEGYDGRSFLFVFSVSGYSENVLNALNLLSLHINPL